jgi:hypothetical protein
MKNALGDTFADRQKTAAEAKAALLARFKPKPTVTDPTLKPRHEKRAEELARVREARVTEKAAKKQAQSDAAADKAAALAADEAAALEAKRGERKERKALTKAEAQAARDAKYAARKARR